MKRCLCLLIFWVYVPLLYAQPKVTPDSVAFNFSLQQFEFYAQKDSQWVLTHTQTLNEYYRNIWQRLHQQGKLTSAVPDTLLWPLPPITPKTPPTWYTRYGGNVQVSLGSRHITDANPTLSPTWQHRTNTLFNHSAQLFLKVGYGDHLKLDLDYSTERDLSQRRYKLLMGYYGTEAELIQHIRVGDIQVQSFNPLIRTSNNLFGLQAELALGPLTLQAVAAQKEGNVRHIRVSAQGARRPFSISAAHYDRNRHYFLAPYFGNHYDAALAQLPLVNSPITIERLQVWVSQPATQETTAQLESVGALYYAPNDTTPPSNETNPNYQRYAHTPLNAWAGSAPANNAFVVHNALRLMPQQYHYNPRLGTLSLATPLTDQQVLLVAFQYRYQGKLYQVGRFTHQQEAPLVAMVLATTNKSPQSITWELMMKNVYALPTGGKCDPHSLQAEVRYKDVATNTLQRAVHSSLSWSAAMGWDKVNAQQEAIPDGLFDALEGVTINPDMGTLTLPYRTPFLTVPQRLNQQHHTRYPVFTALYDSAQVVALTQKQQDVYVLQGEYSATSAHRIWLGTQALPAGSVRVSKGGTLLTEGVDYQVDYMQGMLSLLHANHTATQEELDIAIDDPARTSLIQRNLLGLDAQLQLSPHLQIGASWYGYQEALPLGRIRWGAEPLRNQMYGLHVTYQQPLTQWLDRLPLPQVWNMESPSHFKATVAYAHLKSRLHTNTLGPQTILLDDFQSNTSQYSLLSPNQWRLSGLPGQLEQQPTPARAVNRRALLSWYQVDPYLVREGSPYMPQALQQAPSLRYHPLVCQLPVTALFPEYESELRTTDYLSPLNISYYPNEKGPYNMDPELLTPTGTLNAPQLQWGGMVRTLPVTDLQTAGITYLEGWLMLPYTLKEQLGTGTLWIELGHFSDAFFPHQLMAYESGLPSPQNPDAPTTDTPWGRMPQNTPQTYALDYTNPANVQAQDVGLNGLSSEQEKTYPAYKEYIQKVQALASGQDSVPAALQRLLTDPAGDDYRFYLSPQWDATKANILERYKLFRGLEGNASAGSIRGMSAVQNRQADTEDLVGDFTRRTQNQYFRYKLPLNPFTTQHKFIIGEREVTQTFPNGDTHTTLWVKVRIPLQDYDAVVGQPNWHDIRAIRFLFEGFNHPIHLRWATLGLQGSSWRKSTTATTPTFTPTAAGEIGQVSRLEDGARQPVPYLLRPGTERESTVSRLGTKARDEQSLSLKFQSLQPQQELVAYRSCNYDLRQVSTLSIYTHAEALLNSPHALHNGDLTFFVRLGRDFTDNYYEASIPLLVTPAGQYSNELLQDRQKVWPHENYLQVSLQELVQLKRQQLQNHNNTTEPTQQMSQTYPNTTLTVSGNPSLHDVRAIMVGVRSATSATVSGEVWVDDLAVAHPTQVGGNALSSQLDLKVANLMQWQASWNYMGAGFGDLDSHWAQQSKYAHNRTAIQATLDIAEWLGKSATWHLPLWWSWQRKWINPKYDPLQPDLLLGHGTTPLLAAQSGEYDNQLRLTNWHQTLPPHTVPFYHPARFSFSFEHQSAGSYSPAQPSHQLLRTAANLGYRYETATPFAFTTPFSWSLLPQEWNISNHWERLLERRHLEAYSTPNSTPPTPNSSTITHQFRWDRSLQLKWRLTHNLSWFWHSTTGALIDEPTSFYQTSSPERLRYAWQDSVMHSLLHLGTPFRYQSRSEWNYRLAFGKQHKWLYPLQGNIAYTSWYNWERGGTFSGLFQGHHLWNQTEFNAQLRYNIQHAIRKLPLEVNLTLRHSKGADVPSFHHAAGPLLGYFPKSASPWTDAMYRLGWMPTLKYLQQLQQSQALIQDARLGRASTFYVRSRAELTLTARPATGLLCRMDLSYLPQWHGAMYPNPAVPLNQGGRVRLSTVGLSHFFQNPLDQKQYQSRTFIAFNNHLEVLQKKYPLLPASELYAPALLGSQLHQEASLASVLPLSFIRPNWYVEYAIPCSGRVAHWLNRITLKHAYQGYTEVEDYQSRPGWQPTQQPLGEYPNSAGGMAVGGRFDIQSLTQRDDLAPLVGVSLQFPTGLLLESRLERSRALTLLPPSARWLEQYQWRAEQLLKWQFSPPTNQNLSRWLRGNITLQGSYIASREGVVMRDLSTQNASVSHAFRSARFRGLLDYSLPLGITIQGVYEWTRRLPQAATFAYPLVTRYYGVTLQVHLIP